MNNCAQNQTTLSVSEYAAEQINTDTFNTRLNCPKTQFIAVFKLVGPLPDNRVIVADLSGYEALALLICTPHARIKFVRMEVRQ